MSEVCVLKKYLSALLCVLLVLAAVPAYVFGDGEGEITDERYVVIDDYLFNVLEKTTVEDFLSKGFESVSSLGEYVATGDRAIDKRGNELTVVIYGDADGNGIIDAFDYLLVKRLYMGTVKLEEVFQLACKMNEAVEVFDYIFIKRHVFNTLDLNTRYHRTPEERDDSSFAEEDSSIEESLPESSIPESSIPEEDTSIEESLPETSIPEDDTSFEESTPPDNDKIDGNGIKVAYIPLDNRPVNKDRIEFIAASAGFELLIPEEALYRTALDNMTPNPDGSTIGNRSALLAWLKSVEDDCDYFVISLDQLISGGLVGSRYLSNTDLTFEMEVSDYIISLAKSKHVVLFDTVMRLASTVGYQGYDINTYNTLRAYGKTARKQLSGSELNVENIVNGYRYDANGKKISVNVSNDVLDRYLASRERKLRVIDYLLTNASEDIERIYIGVDDSSPQTTIQTNEINYITSIGGENLTLFAGADELGLMGFAATATDVYGTAKCKVTYFGEGKDWAADEFDTSTLANNVEKHFNSIGATMNSEDADALQVLVLTRSSNVNANADALIKQAIANINAGIPTCIIDASNNTNYLPEKMLNYKYDIAKLLGYSNWNTVANATGIALSNAVARYVYIYNSSSVTEESNKGFVKSLTFSLIKDISYKRKGITDLNNTGAYGPATIVSRVNESQIMVADGNFAEHGRVSVSNFRYPWNRSFEATFDITVADK